MRRIDSRDKALTRRSIFSSPDFVLALLFAASSAFLLWVSYLPREQSLSESLDSMYWPRLVLWGLLGCSILLVGTRVGPGRALLQSEAEGASAAKWPLIDIACCLTYLVLIGIVGFLPSTLVFGAAFPILLGVRDWRRLAVFSVGVTASVWLLVIVAMRVSLPRGVGIFRDLSLLFY